MEGSQALGLKVLRREKRKISTQLVRKSVKNYIFTDEFLLAVWHEFSREAEREGGALRAGVTGARRAHFCPDVFSAPFCRVVRAVFLPPPAAGYIIVAERAELPARAAGLRGTSGGMSCTGAGGKFFRGDEAE